MPGFGTISALQLSRLIGTPEMLALGKRYDGEGG